MVHRAVHQCARLAVLLFILTPANGEDGLRLNRSDLLRNGEAALARGDSAKALEAFERAAAMVHAADAEMSLVRAYMQNGAYRRAAAFAAHAAGAHKEEPAAAVLYAWLMLCGGQTQFAQRIIGEAEARHPDVPLLAQTRAQMRSAAPVASGTMLTAPWRTAPYDSGEALPATARVAFSGLLIDQGRRALVPLIEASSIWLRDGLGRKSAAQAERRVEYLRLMLVRLQRPIEAVHDVGVAPADPFAGSPGFAFQYSQTDGNDPAWPLLHAGFLGKTEATGVRALGVEKPSGAQGGPVLDSAGRLIGLALRDAQGRDRLLPISVLKSEFGQQLGFAADLPSAPRLSADAVYEKAMPITLQVIVLP